MEAAMKEIRLPKSIKPVQYLPFLTFSLFLHWFIVTFFTTRRLTLIMPDSPERLTLIWTLRKKPTLWCWMPRNYVLLYFYSLLTPSFVPTACIVLKVSSEWQRDWHSWVFGISLYFLIYWCRTRFIKNDERLIFLLDSSLLVGKAKLTIQFTGILNDYMEGFYRSSYTYNGEKRYMSTTQFESTSARLAFPCWDEPELKSTFDVFNVHKSRGWGN